MIRDHNQFPDDEIGNLLWQWVTLEVDLTLPYEVEFSVIFSEQQQALEFGQLLLENGQKLSFSPYQGSDTHPWEITAYPQMPLTYQNIISYQALLSEHCLAFSGLYDGWYCPEIQCDEES